MQFSMNADNTGVTDPSKVEEKDISLGRNDEEYIEVTDGLSSGDIVLVKNQASNAMAALMVPNSVSKVVIRLPGESVSDSRNRCPPATLISNRWAFR